MDAVFSLSVAGRGQLPRARPDPESERGTQPRFARFALHFEVLETPPMREFESTQTLQESL